MTAPLLAVLMVITGEYQSVVLNIQCREIKKCVLDHGYLTEQLVAFIKTARLKSVNVLCLWSALKSSIKSS